jgi:cytochrome c-type biogenesis protein CcmH/NrfF
MTMRGVKLVLALVAMVLVWAAPLTAQNPESGLVVPPLTPAQEAQAHEAMTRLRSPVTAFHTVDMCPSSGALRDTIRVAAANGQTADQIVEGVIGRYGERLRILPKRSGVGLAAWLGPIAVLLLGGAFIMRRLRRERASAVTFPVSTEPVSSEDRTRLEEAMRELEAVGGGEP